MMLKVDYLPICLTNDLPIGKKGKTNDFRPFLYAKRIAKCNETEQFSVHFQVTTKRKGLIPNLVFGLGLIGPEYLDRGFYREQEEFKLTYSAP
jgi:hypothetical protein